MLDADLQRRLVLLFSEAHGIARNLDTPFALENIDRKLVEAQEILDEHYLRLRFKPNGGGDEGTLETQTD